MPHPVEILPDQQLVPLNHFAEEGLVCREIIAGGEVAASLGNCIPAYVVKDMLKPGLIYDHRLMPSRTNAQEFSACLCHLP